jgi:hypothetical protein
MGLSLVGSVLELLLDSAFSTAAPPTGINILMLREQENPLAQELDYLQSIIISNNSYFKR